MMQGLQRALDSVAGKEVTKGYVGCEKPLSFAEAAISETTEEV